MSNIIYKNKHSKKLSSDVMLSGDGVLYAMFDMDTHKRNTLEPDPEPYNLFNSPDDVVNSDNGITESNTIPLITLGF